MFDVQRETWVRDGVSLADVLLDHVQPGSMFDLGCVICWFSDGMPGQGGAGHIILRSQNDRAKMVADQAHDCHDPIRHRVRGTRMRSTGSP